MKVKIASGIVGTIVLVIVSLMTVGVFAQETPESLAQPVSAISPTSTTQAAIEPSMTTTEAPTSTTQIPKPTTTVRHAKSTTSSPATTPNSVAGLERRSKFATPLAAAQSMVGVRPDYASAGFWCDAAVNDWAHQAGVPGWIDRSGPSGMFNDALKADRVHPLPLVGDMVFFDLRDPAQKAPSDIPDVQVMHIGVIESVSGESFVSIQGNAKGSDVIVRRTNTVSDGFTIAFASFAS